MAQPRNLRNPPIVEAIVDIGVRFSVPGNAERFAELLDDIRSDYKGPEQRHMYQIVLGPPPPGQTAIQPAVSAPVNNYLFRSTIGSTAVQSKSDGVTFSRLPPYQHWDDLISGALRIWEKYRARFLPERVVRCSVRYINRLMLPGPMLDFDNYLIGVPKIPPELPQILSDFDSSYVLPQIAPGAISRVRMAFSVREVTSSHIPVLLDIDILQECDFDPVDIAAIKKTLDSLRVLKNHVFFGTLTERAVEVFE